MVVDAPQVSAIGAAELRDDLMFHVLCHNTHLPQAPLGPLWVGGHCRQPHGRGTTVGASRCECGELVGARAALRCLWGAEE